MARILWLNWSGGGNLPPSLGVARVLTERGHLVAFAGRPEMVPRVKTAGFRAIEITDAYAEVDRYPQGHFMTRAACYLTSPAVEAQVESIVAAEAPDIVLIDAMFPAALTRAPHFGRPLGGVRPHFRVSATRHVAQVLRRLRRHAAAGRFCRLAVARRSVAAARPHRLDEPRRIRRAACSRLGDGPPRRAGARRRKICGADDVAVARGRSDPACHGQLQHRLRAAQRR